MENLVKHQKVSNYYENDCGLMLEKEKVGVIFFFSVTKILHATNLMEVKQEYLLIKDNNDICKSET